MYDMLGVKVANHPNMKRLIMPDDWYDHPLKKTYPLQGDEVASWYEVDKILEKEARDILALNKEIQLQLIDMILLDLQDLDMKFHSEWIFLNLNQKPMDL